MRKVLLFVLITLCVFKVKVYGQEVPRIQEIVIEETEEIKALKERKSSLYSKTIITKKELEELGGQTAADVLRRLPRLYFSGPPGTNKDIRMIGLDKEFQNVMINGQRPPSGGEKREFALDRIPIELIERIEILKNPTAAYDSDSIAGIVNIILKEPPQKVTFNASAGFLYNDIADKDGNKFSLSFGDKRELFSYLIGGVRTDDYRGKNKEVNDLSKNENEKETEIVRILTSSLNLSLTLSIDKRDKLTFKPYLTDQSEEKNKEKLLTNLLTLSPKNKNIEREKKNQYLESYTLEWERKLNNGSKLKTLISTSQNEETKDKKTEVFAGATLAFDKNIFEKEKKEDREIVFAGDFKTPVSGPFDMENILSLGIKYRNKDRDVEKLVYEVNKLGAVNVTSTPQDSYKVEESITAIYIMDEAFVTEKLNLVPGLRVEITDGGYKTHNGLTAEDSFIDWNPSLHVLFKPGDSYRLRGSVAKTIGRPPFKDKVPTRSEKKDKIEEGNPELKASRSLNYEAAIEKYFGKANIISIGGFYRDVEDIIERQQVGTDTITGKPIIKPVNVSEAKIKGIELEFKTTLDFINLNDLAITGNYTILSSKVTDPNTGQGRKLKDQPERLGNLILRYDSKKYGFVASIGMSYLGKKIDETEATKPKKVEESFTQWDLSFQKDISKKAVILGSVTNIFNEQKRKTEGLRSEVEETGRTFFVGIKVEI